MADLPVRAVLLLAAVVLVAASARAAGPDPARGQAIAVGSGPQGMATVCITCHGSDGTGDGRTGVPRLAGLPTFYLEKQLGDYASGWRSSAVMRPIAEALDEAGRRDVAAYYALLPPPPADAVADPAADHPVGARLARIGAPSRDVPACDACHGPRGRGNPPYIPPLAGQHALYLAEELAAWKAGERANDPLGSMAWAASLLTDTEIAAVAAYYAALPPPSTAP